MEKVKRAQLIVRQHSKVEKIPDEESEELLLKKVEATDNGQGEKTVEHSLSLKIPCISNKNTTLVRTLSHTSENDETAAGSTLNGNLHIFMPNTNETFGGAVKYRSEEGKESNVQVHPDKKKLKSTRKKGLLRCIKSKCSRQSVINIMFGLFIAISLVIGIRALLANSTKGQHNMYLYCYPCQNVNKRIMIEQKNNMCCTKEPIPEISSPKTSPQISDGPGKTGTSSYDGTRILEFQADFHTKWKHENMKDIIQWTPVTSMKKSFARATDSKIREIELLHDGSYVIMLSLTTDTFIAQSSEVRANACLVFKFPDGIYREECRQITHTDKMIIPFEIFKFEALKNGTVIHSFITSSKVLSSHSNHNKLYIVLL